MTGTAAPTLPRRTREEISAEVRRATLELAEQLPFKDLTVDQIARAAGLTRTAFYFYFRSKQDLLRATLEEVADETYREADRWWHGEGEPEQLIRTAIEGVVGVYLRHANLMRVAHEVATYDAEVGALWQRLTARFIDGAADHMRREQDAGRLRPLDPDATAEALILMTESSSYSVLGVGRRPPAQLVDTLTAIWFHALYADAA